MKRERVCILGATGSIGASALDVIARNAGRFEVVALSAARQVEALAELCERWHPRVAVIADAAREAELRHALQVRGLATEARAGAAALAEVAVEDVDVVVAAIVGAAGLLPTLAAARAGKRLLLANKEALVCAGSLLMDAARAGGATLLPVDSEHNAIHQCLAGAPAGQGVRRLVLTASGGPFRTRRDLSEITPEQAVAHPNWVMGRKISVDSATLMNKGLEVIEAGSLFDLPGERIDVVVHPQSVIHSMVEFDDGSVVAQMGTPDMRTPIAYCLGHPERIDSGSARLDFLALGALTFEAPDPVRFPCLQLAWDAMRMGTRATGALNVANEEAVAAFLDRRLAFTAIPRVIEVALAGVPSGAPRSVEEVLGIDAEARAVARACIEQLATAVA